VAKIKIIDDDVEQTENVAECLRAEGHDVATMDDTEGAIEALVADKPNLLVLDVMFPENPSGGFDLARKIRSTREISDLPIILLTSVNQLFPMDFSSDDIDPDWMPVQEFMEKPVDPNKLVQNIAKLLGA
jgi:DNA-binding response OmpR family regulator